MQQNYKSSAFQCNTKNWVCKVLGNTVHSDPTHRARRLIEEDIVATKEVETSLFQPPCCNYRRLHSPALVRAPCKVSTAVPPLAALVVNLATRGTAVESANQRSGERVVTLQQMECTRRAAVCCFQ